MNVDLYVKRDGEFFRMVEMSEDEVCVVEWLPYADGKDRLLRMWWQKSDLDKEPDGEIRDSNG